MAVHDHYQMGRMAQLLTMETLIAERAADGLDLGDGDVVFLGTVPVIDGDLHVSTSFRARLRDPAPGAVIETAYEVAVRAGEGGAMRKPEIEFTPVDTTPWTPVDPRCPGLTERMLAQDGDGPLATRILRFAAGTDTSVLGTMVHDFWEEVYILWGDLHDLSLGRTFEKDAYACRPPGMRHGPWTSKEGCLTLEVRYPPYERLAPE